MQVTGLFLLALVAFSGCPSHASKHKHKGTKGQASTAVGSVPSDSIVEDVVDGNCACMGAACECCAQMNYEKKKQRLCLKGQFNVKTLGAEISFRLNDKSRWKHNFKAEQLKFCPTDLLPPPMDYLRFCMGIYYVNLNPPNLGVLCFYGEFKVIVPLFTVDFHCLKYANRRIGTTKEIPFKKMGIFHLNLKGLDSEVSFHGKALLKGIYDNTVGELMKGLSTKKTKWEKAKYLTESCWEMTPISHIMEGAKEIAPLLQGAGSWLVTEALDSLKGIAEEMATDMENMNPTQKTLYLSQKVVLFLPNMVIKTGDKLTPFVSGILKFGAKKLSCVYDELRVIVGKKLKDWKYKADDIMKQLDGQIKAGLNFGGEVVIGLASSIAQSYKSLGGKLKDIVTQIVNLKDELDIPYYLDRVFQVVSPITTRATEAIKNFGEKVVKGVSDAGNAIKQVYNTAVDKVERGLTSTKNWFRDKFS